MKKVKTQNISKQGSEKYVEKHVFKNEFLTPYNVKTKQSILINLKNGEKKPIEYLYNKYKSLVEKRLKPLKAQKDEIDEAYSEFFQDLLLRNECGSLPEITDFAGYIISSCNYILIKNREKNSKEANYNEFASEQVDEQYDYEYDKFEQLALDKIANLSDVEKEIIHKSFASENRNEIMSKYNLTQAEYYKEQKRLRNNLISQIIENYEKNK